MKMMQTMQDGQHDVVALHYPHHEALHELVDLLHYASFVCASSARAAT